MLAKMKKNGAMLWFCLGLGLPILSANATPTHIELPGIGDPSDNAMSPEDEKRLGAQVVRNLRKEGAILDDPILTEYLTQIGSNLVQKSGDTSTQFHFFLVKDTSINAFALPGGYIGINAGLILAARNESELAGVMAHEVAHVTQRHIARIVGGSKGMNIVAAAAVLAAILLGGTNPELAQAALITGTSLSYQSQINFTREHEMEADRVGLRNLAASGYSPQGMASFFERLDEQGRLYGGNIPEMLRTHPLTTNRIADARARADAYRGGRIDSAVFMAMQARTKVLAESDPAQTLDFFQRNLTETINPSAEQKTALNYGLAIAKIKNAQYQEAQIILNTLLKNQPDNLYFILAQAELYTRLGKSKEALTLLNNVSQWQISLPLLRQYAETHLQFNQYQAARNLLLKHDLEGWNEPALYRLMAEAAGGLGRSAEALYQMSEFYRIQRDFPKAKEQLEAALRVDNLSNSDKARLEARLQILAREMGEK